MNLIFSLVLVIFCFTLGYCNSDLRFKKGAPIIGISNGFLQGKIYSSRDNRLYYGFRGIPYAQAPVRFMDAEPAGKWEGLKNAVEFGPPCSQSSETSEPIGDEDCLFLNVYFPKDIKDERKVPVLVYIDGSEFLQGGGHNLGADNFMDEDIVLVTVNYRLGALGFLNTGDEEITGNFGMKDLVLALKWIQKEIKVFGGDTEKVTIFGQNSGASAVHYLILSPLAKGLFHHGISQSGTALNPSTFDLNPSQSTRRLAEKLDCSFAGSKDFIECIRNKSASDIVLAQHSHWYTGATLKFTPTVDTLSSASFLPDTPYNLIVTGRHAYVPWIIGGNDDEGLRLTEEIFHNESHLKRLKTEWNMVAPDFLDYRNSVASGELDNISKQIWTAYFNESKEITPRLLGNIVSDRHYWLGYKTAAFYHSKSAKTFPYVFGATTANGADLQSLFFSSGKDSQKEKESIKDDKFSKALIKLWISFAETGKPTKTWGSDVAWHSIPPSRIGILAPLKWYYITETKTKFLSDDSERIHFWHTLGLKEFTVADTRPIKDEF